MEKLLMNFILIALKNYLKINMEDKSYMEVMSKNKHASSRLL